MGRLLPFKSEPTRTPDEPRVLDLDDEATEAALSALSSDTARTILATLYEEPKTPPEIRDEVGTSLQNVHYHVERLEDAELIQPAGEGYSEKGTEMTIYAPASEALVLFAGQEHDRSRLKTALTRLLGSVGLLAVASLAVRRLFGESGADLGDYGVSFGASSQSGDERGAGGGDSETGGDGADAGASGGDGGGTVSEPGTDTATATTTESGDIGIFGGADTATDAGGATASPTPEPATATQATPTATEAPSVTATPAGTPAPTPASTPTPAATPSPTAAPTPTATPQPTPTTTDPPSPTPTETGMDSGTITLDTATQVPAGTVDGARQVAGSGDSLLADPAFAFFLGGLFMLLVVTAWWYVQG
ncbi:helix-turn-helix transcriptional regulator [Halosimplex litoreum]|uniref:Helix-turn-helix transcriptional regulator n=1 Tax=Halosimplex litoreum TaxID=1198301 RepID=A0A7T3KVH5_9EURY|nr:winged helix-turn-helix domain-containing protein [Halosimplex litoreum]QPV63013.1 helix-turn-helix transcriptional regulator [Halosimplex litoreum]